MIEYMIFMLLSALAVSVAGIFTIDVLFKIPECRESEDMILSIVSGINRANDSMYISNSKENGIYIIYEIELPRYIFFTEKRYNISGFGLIPKKMNTIVAKIIESKQL